MNNDVNEPISNELISAAFLNLTTELKDVKSWLKELRELVDRYNQHQALVAIALNIFSGEDPRIMRPQEEINEGCYLLWLYISQIQDLKAEQEQIELNFKKESR